MYEKKDSRVKSNMISNKIKEDEIQNLNEKLENKQTTNLIKSDPYDEDEDPQWVDVDVTEFQNVKMEFRGLPGEDIIKCSLEDKLPKKEKLVEIKEDLSLHDESHDDHLEKIIKLNLTIDDEKINDDLIIKDLKGIPTLNPENLFNMNYDIFNEKKIMNEDFLIDLNNEKKKEIFTIEKNSLFEKDFTFIFKSSHENKDPYHTQNSKENCFNEQVASDLTSRNDKNTLKENSISNKQAFFQIEQSTNILFENNIFEKDKINKQTDRELEELINLQKNLLPNNINQLDNLNEEDEDEEIENTLNFKSILPQKNNLNNTFINPSQIPNQLNMNMRIGMPFNLPQNPNMIPIPIHPINVMNNFGNFEEMNQNENMLKNPFMKNNQMNQNRDNQMINHVYLENPNSIVHKNMYNKGWLLMTLNDKIIGQFNSIDLFKYLDKKILEGWNFENTWITDYDTDIYFTPSNLYEILKEIVPNVIVNINKNKNPQMNFPINLGINPNLNINPTINPLNPNFNPGMNFNPIHFNIPPQINMRQINSNDNKLGGNNNNNISNNIPMRMNTPPPNMNMNSQLMRMVEREESMNVNNMKKMPNMMNQFPLNMDPRCQAIPQNLPPNFNFPNNMQNMQPPLNMNINLQFVKNNINLNNIMLNNSKNNNKHPNVTVAPKSNLNSINNNNKSVQEKIVPGLGNKDMNKSNNNNNCDSNVFSSLKSVHDKNNSILTNNNTRSTNQAKKKK